MKLPQLLYNKTDIFILLCLRLSLYCPLQGAAVVGGNKTWPQRLGTRRHYQHYPGRLWDCGHDLGCFDVQSSVEHETKNLSLQCYPGLQMRQYMSNVFGICRAF